MSETLTFAASAAAALEPHLPPPNQPLSRPHVTLTFATSLDSSLALAPGVRTRLSGAESKAMTHHLRSRHAAILIGVSTMLADDPGLNCRIDGAASHPRPVVVDPNLRWTPNQQDKVLQLCREGKGLAPLVVTSDDAAVPDEDVLTAHGGRYVRVKAAADGGRRLDWRRVFAALAAEGLDSIMVEGGGTVINSLLAPDYHDVIDSVIVTIAPVWLGKGGVVVSPDRVVDESGPLPAARLTSVSWLPLGEDVVLCGRLR